MNSTIMLLDEHEMNPSTDMANRDSYYVRTAVRAVFKNSEGRIALMHAKQRDYYKLPGGGVDEGEGLRDALERELLEETGSKANIIKELGQVIEWRDFRKMKQISYAFEAALVGDVGQPSFTQSEIDEGFEVEWIENLEKAIELVESRVSHGDIEVVFMAKRDTAILRSAQ